MFSKSVYLQIFITCVSVVGHFSNNLWEFELIKLFHDIAVYSTCLFVHWYLWVLCRCVLVIYLNKPPVWLRSIVITESVILHICHTHVRTFITNHFEIYPFSLFHLTVILFNFLNLHHSSNFINNFRLHSM